MIRNVIKSYITTIIGVLFFFADIVYVFVKEDPSKSVLATLAVIGFVMLFMSDKYAKGFMEKIKSKI